MDVNTIFGSDTLKAADLNGREVPLTIASVEAKQFNDGNKLIVRFNSTKKSLVVNKTNAQRIAHLHGKETEMWIGKKIVLYQDFAMFNGQQTPCIRVKGFFPQVQVTTGAQPMQRPAPMVPTPMPVAAPPGPKFDQFNDDPLASDDGIPF